MQVTASTEFFAQKEKDGQRVVAYPHKRERAGQLTNTLEVYGCAVSSGREQKFIFGEKCVGYGKEGNMRILVDADACPVVRIIEKTAKKYGIPVVLLCDTNHILRSEYSEVITVGAGADAVDFKLVNICQKEDIVVTQDYGVAAMILGKGAYGIHQSGRWYTNDNIDQMLMERYMAKKARNAKKRNHIKGPAKRTEGDDARFEQSLEKLIQKLM